MAVVYIILTCIAAFILVIILRAFAFKPKPQNITNIETLNFDKDKCINALAQLVRCKTISYNDHSYEDDSEFKKLINLLPKLYPYVFKKCTYTELDNRALLFKWPGKSSSQPTVLMAHYDVVAVNEEDWEKPPFDAIIENGIMWGRGTLDTKVTFNAALFATNTLIENGFEPENDIYLAFSGGEEINGKGAVNIVDYFEKNNIIPALVVDEGGAVVENVFPGVKQQCALIGIAEKGLMNLEYLCTSQGGHASAPLAHTPVGVLSKACTKVEDNPPKMHITKPVAEMFDTLGRYSSFLYKVIFSNLWCFKWVLDIISKKSGGEINALMRTTVAFTMMSGSNGRNVIPPKASMISNIRINPADNIDSVISHISKTIKNPNVTLNLIEGTNPSRISQTNCKAWDTVKNAVASTWPNAIVSPYLMVQCSDSRHYGRISDRVYRFSAMDLTTEERKTIHGNNERIRLESICKATDFYIRLIKQC